MLGPFVCIQCRRRLFQHGQRIRNIGFVSLSPSAQVIHDITPRKNDDQVADKHNERANVASRGRQSRSTTRQSQRSPRPLSSTDSALESLFASNQRSKPWEKPKIYTEALLPTKNKTRSLDRFEDGISDTDKIIAMLEKREKELAKWISDVRASLDGLEQYSTSALIENRASEPDCDMKTWNTSQIHRNVTTLILDLQRATDRHDVARVAAIWRRYHDGSLAKTHLEAKSREQIYISFLSSFVTLARPEQAVHVWNDMLEAGVIPNQRHWNLMLKGSAKARDPTSLEDIWRYMVNAGIEPDQPCWTTYIHGLITGGKWQRGVRVLHDLGSHWRRAHMNQRKHVESAVAKLGSLAMPKDKDPSKPSLAPVMAAVSALTAIERHEQCLPLLQFATSHSLALTTDIFNILLRPAIRHGNIERIDHIFALMRQHNCSENETTYRILLNGHMSNKNSTFPLLCPREQQDSVFRILDSMTAQKIPIDQKTYSTILYGLLSPKNATYNDQAARAVLDHMAKQGIKPSTYIYSILVTHYFAIDPPNLPAVEALWQRIRAEKPILDREFYERMVEGYARVQSVERMLFFLRRIPHEGKAPGWRCLRVVLGALVEVGEWGLVGELVGDVRDTRQGLRRWADEKVDSKAEGEFWDVVEEVRYKVEEAEQSSSMLPL